MKNLRSFPVSLCSLRSSQSVGTGRNTRTTHTVYVVVFLGLGRENKGDNVREGFNIIVTGHHLFDLFEVGNALYACMQPQVPLRSTQRLSMAGRFHRPCGYIMQVLVCSLFCLLL